MEMLHCGECSMTFGGGEEMLVHEPKAGAITFRSCQTIHVARTTVPYLCYYMTQERSICLKHFSCAKCNESVCFTSNTTCSVSHMILWTYALSFAILARWRPESILLHIACRAISVHIDVHVTSCRPMSGVILQSYDQILNLPSFHFRVYMYLNVSV